MKRFFMTAMMIAAATTFIACEKNNSEGIINKEVEEALIDKYPSATQVDWASKDGYSVAAFRNGHNGDNCSAWFDHQGGWHMTKTDISYNQLPDAVRSAFEASEYATWEIDDIDKIERREAEVVYVIEVEGRVDGREVEFDLYYSTDGVLIKAINDDDDDDDDYSHMMPPSNSGNIKSAVMALYPNARIIEIDKEDRTIEVEIIDNRIKREVVFSLSLEWLYTETDDIRYSQLPDAVKNRLATDFASYEIDDIEQIDTPNGTYYEIELEREDENDNDDDDIDVKIDSNGNILKA